MFDNLPTETFEVVYADPPWGYYGSQVKWGAAAKFYDTVDDATMLSFPLRHLLAERSVLFMWATSPRLDFAMKCIECWGLHYRGIAFVWIKTKQDGTPIGAQGVRPSVVKPTVEYVLAASPIEKGRPLKLFDESIPNTVFAPRTEHSVKPEEVHGRIERMYPSAKKLELFARSARPGWVAWGQEIEAGPRQLLRGHGSKNNARVKEALSVGGHALSNQIVPAQQSLFDPK